MRGVGLGMRVMVLGDWCEGCKVRGEDEEL